MNWGEEIRRGYIQDLDNFDLNNLKEEIIKSVDNIGGNEVITESIQILFEDMQVDIIGTNKTKYKRMLGDLETCFKDLIDEFKDYYNVKISSVDFNVYNQIWQLVRFLDFIETLRNFDEQRAYPDLVKDYEKMIRTWYIIRDFVFTHDPWKPVLNVNLKLHFDKLMGFSRRNRLGIEAYYAKATGELLRTLRNYKQHGNVFQFHDPSITSNFHSGFIQLFSIYTLSCYSYLELLKYWERNKNFLDGLLRGDLI